MVGRRRPIVGSCDGSWVEVGIHVIKQANSGPLSALRVVNLKKHLIMGIQNGSREAALANQVGWTSFTDNEYPKSACLVS